MNKLIGKIFAIIAVLCILVFIFVILPNVRTNMDGGKLAKCANAYDCKSNKDGTANCFYDSGNGVIEEVVCSYED